MDDSASASPAFGWLRPALSVIATLAVTLVAYGAVYNLGRPRNPHPDPLLAARLLPLELLVGVLVGVLAYRAFGARQAQVPRPDVQERMVTRLALRRGGTFTLEQLTESSPLDARQAREVLARMQQEGRVVPDGGAYRLPDARPDRRA
ncbi:hypothetical protein [Deinococcus aquiradiocola]|uniref:Uncharacterized protein n=1 Tax=Deinococcus aquiradiocola TaxID=393059 RepID=A0A917PFX8_9DEIO|nr:hypothetical protein [Deinococcus aquiradiocola]GGJ74446.1 hypothetical protein GCM10008939_18450 [Deinococcus aquiradiocola]